MGCYGRMLLMLAETRITRILALFVMCGVERFTLSLNQSISLTLVKLRPVLYHPKLQSYNMIH